MSLPPQTHKELVAERQARYIRRIEEGSEEEGEQ